ncbi:MAG: NDP-sugar synthase [Elusimicrobiota bacterium]|nr:NDP-sugar synthase [Endomicrobiia bacterium]MDW8055609.1 NDP-sugar synthase [Elusimicrobiota bacterium]
MKAFIMAAGFGTRLRPLTYSIPKPLVPIMNYPVIGHLMNNLKSYGIKEVVVNLHYQPEFIKSFLLDGTSWGIRINYSYEPKLLGTAGGVKIKQYFFDKTFIVLSGDGLSDINLSKLIKFHKRKKALCTVALKPVDMKLEYGVVSISSDNRITNFYEKPSIGEIFTNLVNTGIYVFEPEIFKHIPKGKSYDFGKQLLPKLVSKSLPVYGYVMEEYWCDVGNLSEYKKAHYDCLDGKLKVYINAKQVKKGIWIGENTNIVSSVKLTPPCLIGNNVKIGRNAIIGSYTVIGDNCIIGNNSKIYDSILWNNVIVRSNVKLRSCIIGNDAVVSENITMFEGTILNIEI